MNFAKIIFLKSVLILMFTSNQAFALEILTVGDSITQGLFRTFGGSQSGVTSPQNGSINFGGYQPRLNQRLDSEIAASTVCLLYTSPSPRDLSTSRMPSSA